MFSLAKRPSVVVVAIALILATLSMTSAAPRPAEAAIDDVQRANWGLATFGQSRAIANFSALGWAVEEVASTVYAGGNFLDVTNGQRTERQPYLAAFDTTTGAWDESFRPQVGGPVLALEPGPDGTLFVGGEMDEWNGVSVGALVKIDPATGDLAAGWDTRLYGGTSVVRDLSLGPDGWLYAVGTFTTASDAQNPQPVESVIRLDPTTGDIDWSWVPSTGGGGLWGVSASYTRPVVYLAGWNNVKNGRQVVGLDATDPDQVTWSGFQMNYPCCSHMYDIQATPHGTVLAVGEQHGAYLYDENDDMAQIIGHTTSYDRRYQNSNSRRGGDYQDIELVGDTLYASCHCWGSHSTGIGYTPRYSGDLSRVSGTHTGLVSTVIAYDARTGVRDRSFDPYMAGDIGAWGVLEASDGCLWIAGGINAVGPPGDQAPGRDLVRLCDKNHQPPGAPDGPATCQATVDDQEITVTWDGVAGATDYVIHRSVEGGPPSWRGVSAASPFVDSNRDADLTYTVSSRDAQGRRSEPTECGLDEVPVEAVDAPASCLARFAANAVTVTWDGVDGAADYVVYRTVDGGARSWRGRTTNLSFTDTDRDAELVYSVASRDQAQRRSDATECAGEVVEQPELVAPANCVATISPQGIEIGWDPAAEATSYVVYRTVDGGPQFWRGVATDTAFSDSFRSGSLSYFVASRAADGRRSERGPCATAEGPPPPPPDPVEAVGACDVTVDGGPNDVTVSWDPVAEVGAVYIVSRTVDGGAVFWRGRTAGSSFDDTLRPGAISYRVEVKVDDRRSDATICQPDVQGV